MELKINMKKILLALSLLFCAPAQAQIISGGSCPVACNGKFQAVGTSTATINNGLVVEISSRIAGDNALAVSTTSIASNLSNEITRAIARENLLGDATGLLSLKVATAVYTTGSYTDPAWLYFTDLARINASTVTTAIGAEQSRATSAEDFLAAKISTAVYTTGSYTSPSWLHLDPFMISFATMVAKAGDTMTGTLNITGPSSYLQTGSSNTFGGLTTMAQASVGAGGLTATASTTTLSRLDVGGKIGISSPTANSLLSIDGNPGGNPLVSVINSLNDNTKLLHIGTQNNYFDFWRDYTTGHLNIQGSQSEANSIVLAPTSGNVGIGTTNPGNLLTVNGQAQINTGTVGTAILGAGELFRVSNGTFTVEESGIVSAPSQPFVRAPGYACNMRTGDYFPIFFAAPAAGDDTANMYGGAASSGTFTVKAAGVYQTEVCVAHQAAALYIIKVQKGGADYLTKTEYEASGNSQSTCLHQTAKFAANDAVTVLVYQNNVADVPVNVGYTGWSYFSMTKLW